MVGLQSGEGCMMIDSVVWVQHINVTDRQPRRQKACLCVVCSVQAENYECWPPPPLTIYTVSGKNGTTSILDFNPSSTLDFCFRTTV